MSDLTLPDILGRMRAIDVAMLMTCSDDGRISGRPVNNHQEVDFCGNSYYFTWGYSQLVRDIERHPRVALSFQDDARVFDKPMRITVEGEAEVIRDKEAFHEHWSHRLDHWYDRGPDTPGLVMIKVRPRRVHYWDGSGEREIRVEPCDTTTREVRHVQRCPS